MKKSAVPQKAGKVIPPNPVFCSRPTQAEKINTETLTHSQALQRSWAHSWLLGLSSEVAR